MVKVIAFYLPQYHEIPENNKWWGEGFTEWANVKKSKPTFKGQIQPESPLKGNYYDLSNPEVMVEQAALAKKYGINGFCYYHYWFNGKLLLQKPLENMLKNKNVNIPFCISWANETWSRNWNGQNTKILIKQNYNETKEMWKKHFDYLLPFFKDNRYIYYNEKPLMIIYKPYLIHNCEDMLQYWDKLARDYGLEGLSFAYQHHTSFLHPNPKFDFGIEFEPFYTIGELKKKGLLPPDDKKEKVFFYEKHPRQLLKKIKEKLDSKPTIYDYDAIWKDIISRKNLDNHMPGAFPAWDNTPRRGVNAQVFFEATPQKFEKYIDLQLEKSIKEGKEYLFVNAWNEWAEGAHLEPDEYNKFGYLEAVKKAINKTGVKHE